MPEHDSRRGNAPQGVERLGECSLFCGSPRKLHTNIPNNSAAEGAKIGVVPRPSADSQQITIGVAPRLSADSPNSEADSPQGSFSARSEADSPQGSFSVQNPPTHGTHSRLSASTHHTTQRQECSYNPLLTNLLCSPNENNHDKQATMLLNNSTTKQHTTRQRHDNKSKKKNKQRKRGGINKKRSNPMKPKRDKDHLTIFFGSTTPGYTLRRDRMMW